jgi:hypothetical protein
MGIASNMVAGFGLVLGLEVVLLVTNVLSSYVTRDGSTLQEMLESKVGNA